MAHPTGDRILRQLREAFAFPRPYRYVLFDHDAKFSPAIREFLVSSGMQPIRTSIRSPWQNGIADLCWTLFSSKTSFWTAGRYQYSMETCATG